MRTQEILAQVAANTISPEEAGKLLAKSNGTPGLQVGRNSKGGLFMRNPAWKAYSEAKAKEYTVSVNIPAEFAKPFFRDPEAVKRAVQEVASW
jgi:hypothetical protein